MKWSIREFTQATGGQVLSLKKEKFDSVCIDTRKIKDDRTCFFALKGKLDGHSFLQQACKQRAAVLVVEYLKDESLKKDITIIQVPKVEKALRDFAFYWREKLDFKVVGITGSVGKTASKHFCQILFQKDSTILVSPLNYNNNLGVSLSLLGMEKNHKVLIQEIGTSRSGEIRDLCQLAQPDIATCTLVGWSHAEGLGGIKEIAREKEYIYEGAELGIFNLDNSWTREMSFHFKGQNILTFSRTDSSADIFLELYGMGVHFLEVRGSILNQKGSCRIPVSGSHYLCSVMVSIGVAVSLGYRASEIWNSLPLLSSYENRSQWVDWGSQKVFFDAYNANPSSMDAFLKYIEFLIQQKKSVVLLLGDMLELGSRASSFHKELGKKVARLSVSSIFYIGRFRLDFEKGLKYASFNGNYKLFKSYDRRQNLRILSSLNDEDILAIKASRGVCLDRVMADIKSP